MSPSWSKTPSRRGAVGVRDRVLRADGDRPTAARSRRSPPSSSARRSPSARCGARSHGARAAAGATGCAGHADEQIADAELAGLTRRQIIEEPLAALRPTPTPHTSVEVGVLAGACAVVDRWLEGVAEEERSWRSRRCRSPSRQRAKARRPRVCSRSSRGVYYRGRNIPRFVQWQSLRPLTLPQTMTKGCRTDCLPRAYPGAAPVTSGRDGSAHHSDSEPS